MSAHYYKWAWAQSLPALEKMVLFNLVERSDEEGSSYPSIARIALDTGMNEKTAGAAILSLEKAGLIHVTRRHGHSSTYQLQEPTGSKSERRRGGFFVIDGGRA